MRTKTSSPVQLSLSEDLLGRIDADPEACKVGRSAFVSSAVDFYLRLKERREVETGLLHAYGGEADALLDEVDSLIGAQAWPND